MRNLLISATGLIGLSAFGLMQPAFAGCRQELHACIAESSGHPHICDRLVQNLPTCEANEKVGIQQVSVDPRFTKAAIDALYKDPLGFPAAK